MTRHANIAARRQRFALERPIEEKDGAGGVIRRFACMAWVWGSIAAIGTASAARDVQERPELAQRYRIVMRWRAGLDGTSRLRLGGRVFAVLSATDPDGRRRELVVVAQEVTP
ncbi:head-tail adaptor protein [Pseudochelatococcus sp. B33]